MVDLFYSVNLAFRPLKSCINVKEDKEQEETQYSRMNSKIERKRQGSRKKKNWYTCAVGSLGWFAAMSCLLITSYFSKKSLWLGFIWIFSCIPPNPHKSCPIIRRLTQSLLWKLTTRQEQSMTVLSMPSKRRSTKKLICTVKTLEWHGYLHSFGYSDWTRKAEL